MLIHYHLSFLFILVYQFYKVATVRMRKVREILKTSGKIVKSPLFAFLKGFGVLNNEFFAKTVSNYVFSIIWNILMSGITPSCVWEISFFNFCGNPDCISWEVLEISLPVWSVSWISERKRSVTICVNLQLGYWSWGRSSLGNVSKE